MVFVSEQSFRVQTVELLTFPSRSLRLREFFPCEVREAIWDSEWRNLSSEKSLQFLLEMMQLIRPACGMTWLENDNSMRPLTPLSSRNAVVSAVLETRAKVAHLFVLFRNHGDLFHVSVRRDSILDAEARNVLSASVKASIVGSNSEESAQTERTGLTK